MDIISITPQKVKLLHCYLYFTKFIIFIMLLILINN